MIKFFRKIRQKLLSENKFSKYLIYAIGEIVLVVIGILIALQINNWNEHRKDKATEHTLLIAMHDDLLINIDRLNNDIQIEQNTINATDKYLNLINAALHEINKGQLKKVVLSQPFNFELKDAEPLTVFEKMGPRETEQMKQINQDMYANISADRFYQYWDLNTAFHHVYLDLSSNGPILHQLNILRQRLFEFGKEDWSPKMKKMNYTEHETLIELIEKGDAVEAANFIRDVHCVINY